jgi:hypothetical protein
MPRCLRSIGTKTACIRVSLNRDTGSRTQPSQYFDASVEQRSLVKPEADSRCTETGSQNGKPVAPTGLWLLVALRLLWVLEL